MGKTKWIFSGLLLMSVLGIIFVGGVRLTGGSPMRQVSGFVLGWMIGAIVSIFWHLRGLV